MPKQAVVKTKSCSRYRDGWPLCADECRARKGVWPATLEFFGPRTQAKDGLRPECRACNKARQQTPEYKARNRARNQTPERKAYNRAYRQKPECRACDDARRQTPEYKAHNRAYNQTPAYKVRRRAHQQIIAAEALAGYPDICYVCGEAGGAELHHLWPKEDYPIGPLRGYGNGLHSALCRIHKATGRGHPGFARRCVSCRQDAARALASPNNFELRMLDLLRPLGFPVFTGGGPDRKRIGNYAPDFLHPTLPIIVEGYGDYWHSERARLGCGAANKKRVKFLRKRGYTVLIVWEHDFYARPDLVVKRVRRALAKEQRKLS